MKYKTILSIIVLLAFVAVPFAGELQQSTIKIKGMKCQGCADKVTEALKSVKGVEKVTVDLKTGTAKVVYAEANITELENSILALGFSANDKTPKITHEEWEARHPEAKAECEAKVKASGNPGCCDKKAAKTNKSQSSPCSSKSKAAPKRTK